jgi:hypothetical protein
VDEADAAGSATAREYLAPLRLTPWAEIEAVAPLDPGETVLVDWRISHGGEWIPHAGWLRVTDRRVLILVGRWLGRNRVIELARSSVRVRPGVDGDPVIRLEVAAPVDDDLLAFRSSDLFTVPASRGITLRMRQDTIRTGVLRERLLLALGEAPAAPG